jgi:DNA-binding Xre family transcriptional regulator
MKTKSPKSRAKRRAALKALAKQQGDVIVPKKPQALEEANVAGLEELVTAEVQKRQIGELVSSAMAYRRVGVRELGRRVKRSHSQIIALEKSKNLEISTLLTIADSLDFDVELSLKPREGGQTIHAKLT